MAEHAVKRSRVVRNVVSRVDRADGDASRARSYLAMVRQIASRVPVATTASRSKSASLCQQWADMANCLLQAKAARERVLRELSLALLFGPASSR